MSAFGAIPTEVICRFGELSKTEIIVLSYLYAARNSRTLQCNPKQKAIASAVSVNKTHVARAVRLLKNSGWLEVDREGNFTLCIPSSKVTKLVTQDETESVTESDEIGNSEVTKMVTQVTESVTKSDENGNSTYIYTSLNKEGTKKEQRMSDAVAAAEIFEFWKSVHNHPTARFIPERRKAVLDRLKSGYTQDQIQTAILGCKASPHHQGQNDKRTVYDDLELICRTDKNLERFIGYAENKPKEKYANGKLSNAAVLDEWADIARQVG